jgi:trehalose-6-phosphatase
LRVPDTDAIADVYQRLATMRREYLTENGVL